MTIEQIVDKHYKQLFDELLECDEAGDGMTELLVEVKVAVDGKTIRRSWQDRNEMLRKEEK